MRRILVTLALAGLLLWSAGPASAHVLVETVVPRGDGSAELALTFDHGCTDSPTVSLVVEAPAGSQFLDGTAPTGWTAAVEGGGSRIVFAGPGIGDGQAPRFTIGARLAGSVGQTLLFETRQECANGQGYDWTDASESQDRPAPRIVATAAVLAEQAPPAASAPPALPEDGVGLGQIALAIALLAAAAGVAGHLLLRRS
ncbi:MAG: DUF1775 domain-containing protein [Aeromicrobium sp.]|uniref:DUF1775 domain-containing protein n=1 Tax=Aeromicrobium sp. TaxID=1871063 RepID=UPI0039E6D677